MSATVTTHLLQKALSYSAYKQLTQEIVCEKIPRAGMYMADKTFRYTRSNLERMIKVEESMTLSQKLYNQISELKKEWIWLVLSEPWCGDASWGTPALYLIACATDKIDFKILLRDSNVELMKHYQTAGSDSIPKLVCLRKGDLEEIGTWGPRPQVLHKMVLEGMQKSDFNYRDSVRSIHAWYEKDMTCSIQEELIDLIKDWKNK